MLQFAQKSCRAFGMFGKLINKNPLDVTKIYSKWIWNALRLLAKRIIEIGKKKLHLRWSLCALVAAISHRIRLTRKIIECAWLRSIIPHWLIEVRNVIEHFWLNYCFRQTNWKILDSRKWRIRLFGFVNSRTQYSVQKVQVVCLTEVVNTHTHSQRSCLAPIESVKLFFSNARHHSYTKCNCRSCRTTKVTIWNN